MPHLRIVLLAACSASVPAWSADYPDRPIRFIAPSAAGGSADALIRVLAVELGRQMNQQIVVDNRPGGGSIIGTEMIARAVPDGYTIGYGNAATLAINPSLVPKLSYDVARDLQPVARYNFSQNVLVVNPALPVRSVRELIDHAKKNPGRLLFASVGNGTTIHLAGELFKQMTGVEMVHVPYKAFTQAFSELVGGQVQVMFDNLTSIAPHVTGGKVRGLAVTGPSRTPVLPDLPTVAEAGVPGYEITTWGGVIVPAGVPKATLARLNAEVNRACKSQVLQEKIGAVGNRCVGGTPEDFGAFIRSETSKWAGVIKRSGAKVD